MCIHSRMTHSGLVLQYELFRNHVPPIIYDTIVILHEKMTIHHDIYACKALRQFLMDIVSGVYPLIRIYSRFEHELALLPHKNEYMRELQQMYARLVD